jgi:uncharacterized protein
MRAIIGLRKENISQAAARRVAIAAQGLARRGSAAAPGPRQLDAVLNRIGLLQMDSVSVLARAHYLPLFSRLGGYDTSLLDEAAWGRKRRWFEYWGHEASLLPFALHPLLRWRMAAAASGEDLWPGLSEFQREHGDYIRGVRARIEADGPAVASELDGAKGVPGWWGWGQAKRALEILFWSGELTASGRRGFERVYDLTERVLPAEILAIPTPARNDAQRALLLLSARAHGIGTAGCLADYFRISPRVARPLLAELVEDGSLLPVEIEGLRGEWLLHNDADVPRKVAAQAVLAPFDPLVWERGRVAKLFSFQYRLEIYTPAEKRVHGYYVLPFLLGDRLVARVDLKAERASGTLHVLAAFAEDHAPPATAEALWEELRRLANWLRLEKIVVGNMGNLARRLRSVGRAG